jgi:hypothetical protein
MCHQCSETSRELVRRPITNHLSKVLRGEVGNDWIHWRIHRHAVSLLAELSTETEKLRIWSTAEESQDILMKVSAREM